jgi:hypothetical protein
MGQHLIALLGQDISTPLMRYIVSEFVFESKPTVQ